MLAEVADEGLNRPAMQDLDCNHQRGGRMKSTKKIAVNKIAAGTYRVSSSHGRSVSTGRFLTGRAARGATQQGRKSST